MKRLLLLTSFLVGVLTPFGVCASTGDDNGSDAGGIMLTFASDGLHISLNAGLVNAILAHWVAIQQQRKALAEQARRQAEALDRQALAENSDGAANVEESGDSAAADDGCCDDGQSSFSPVNNVKTKFTDVGGAYAAKHELFEIVDFLKNPKKYMEMGANVPKGVLLFGPPGNGKTLLARAVAGEAGVPFFSVCASEFEQEYVGVGAARIRELFKVVHTAARRKGACILFIDEFDSLAAKRTDGKGHDNAQTLNQLLAELDGFVKSKAPIIVMAATNRLDRLDPAAIRPGRFDRHVEVTRPDLIGRREILQASLKHVKIADNIDVDLLARATPGFSGAELAQFVNEAALHAVAEHHDRVTMQDFDASRDKLIMGHANPTLQLSKESLKKTAYHEAGHALVILLMPEVTDPLYKVTIEPYGSALGFAAYLPEGDRSSYSKDEFLARIMMAVAGRVGEELGIGMQFSGVSSDLMYATEVAHEMVCAYGMSDLGLVAISDGKSNEKVETEERKIIAECYAKVQKLLTDNRGKLDKLAAKLLEKKTLGAAEIYELLGIPSRTIPKIG